MARKGRGWHGEPGRHRLAALKGNQDIEDSRLLLRTLTKRLEGEEFIGPEPASKGLWWKVGLSYQTKPQARRRGKKLRELGRYDPLDKKTKQQYVKLKQQSDGWWAVYRRDME